MSRQKPKNKTKGSSQKATKRESYVDWQEGRRGGCDVQMGLHKGYKSRDGSQKIQWEGDRQTEKMDTVSTKRGDTKVLLKDNAKTDRVWEKKDQ